MRIRLRTFETRVARRVLFLFVACAALPVATFAVVGYLQVRSQLTVQSWERLASAGEGAAHSLLERLLLLEADLARPAGERRSTALTAEGGALWLERDEHGLGAPGVAASVGARGASPLLEGLEERQLGALADGRATLAPAPAGEGLLMLLGRPPEGALRWGRVHPDFLGSVGNTLPDGASLCVFSGRDPLFPCELEIPAAGPDGASSTGSSRLEWRAADGERLGVERELFLAGEYASPSWRVVVSEPRALGLVPIRSFTRTFVLVLFLCTLLVTLASHFQLERTLDPLARLKAGTERVAGGDLAGIVQVRTGDEFEELAKSFNHMVRRIRHLLGELDELNVGTIRALASAIDAKSEWTSGHSDRVTAVSLEIGRALELDEGELEILERGAILHDVGKIAVPTAVLDKAGPLDEEEWRLMRAHPGHGVRIVRPIGRYVALLPIIGQHHERFDGSGYPEGLAGEEIDFKARIVAVADAFDAMTSDRPYRAGMQVVKALSIIRDESGTAFDPEVAATFLRLRATELEAAEGFRTEAAEAREERRRLRRMA